MAEPWQICGSVRAETVVSCYHPGFLQPFVIHILVGRQWSSATVSTVALFWYILLCSLCLCRTRFAGGNRQKNRKWIIYVSLSHRGSPLGYFLGNISLACSLSVRSCARPCPLSPVQLSEIFPRQKYQTAGFGYCHFVLVPEKRKCFLSFMGKTSLSQCLVAVKMTQRAGKAIVVPLTRPPEFLFDVVYTFVFRAWL